MATSGAIPSPTTELEAVNTMLAVIGEAPVNSLDDQLIVDAVIAHNTLLEVSREVQTHGWHFNTETDYPLVPNTSGEIIVPKNCVAVDVDDRLYPDLDVVLRGQRLYDRRNHTYTFTGTLYAEVVFVLRFDEIPEAARRFVTIRAARMFQDRMVGSDSLNGFTEKDEARARILFMGAESAEADYSILGGAGTWSVSDVLSR